MGWFWIQQDDCGVRTMKCFPEVAVRYDMGRRHSLYSICCGRFWCVFSMWIRFYLVFCSRRNFPCTEHPFTASCYSGEVIIRKFVKLVSRLLPPNLEKKLATFMLMWHEQSAMCRCTKASKHTELWIKKGTFLKRPWCRVGRVLQENLVFITELRMQIGHPKMFLRLIFRALAIRQSKW